MKAQAGAVWAESLGPPDPPKPKPDTIRLEMPIEVARELMVVVGESVEPRFLGRVYSVLYDIFKAEGL